MSQRFDHLQAKKELLQMKAQLERMQLGGEIDDLKQQFAWLQLFKKASQWFGQRNVNALGPLGALGGQPLQDWLKQHPMLGLLASTAMLRYRQPLAKVTLRAGMAAVVLATAVFWFKTRGTSPGGATFKGQAGSSAP